MAEIQTSRRIHFEHSEIVDAIKEYALRKHKVVVMGDVRITCSGGEDLEVDATADVEPKPRKARAGKGA